MLCVDYRGGDVYFHLAAEEYLLKKKGGDYFMLWQSAPAVVIGRHQSVQAEVDAAYLRANGIALARRFTGGGAVYHDGGNVNLAFIETAARPRFDGYLQRTVEFLQSLGMAAVADERMGIFVGGRKVSGSAQAVHKERVMYHCTLLFDADLGALNAALAGGTTIGGGHREGATGGSLLPSSQMVRSVPSVRSVVTNICEHLPEPMTMKRFMRLLLRHFLGEEGGSIYRFTGEDIKAIERLRQEKYALPEWVYGGSIAAAVLPKHSAPAVVIPTNGDLVI